MKLKATYNLFVPAPVKAIIDNNVKRNRESYYYIIDYILKRQPQKKFVKIHVIELTNGKSPKTYIRTLKKLKIIVDDGKSIKDKKRLHYAVCEHLIKDLQTIEIKPDSHFYNMLYKPASKKNYRQKLKHDHLFKMYQSFSKLKINESEALKHIEKYIHEPKRKFYHTLSVLNFKNTRFGRNKTNNRLDSNLTNLPESLRKFVFNDDYVSIDISNSQFVFLYYLYVLLTLTTHTFICSQIKFNNLLKDVGNTNLQQIHKILKNANIDKNKYFIKFKRLVLSGELYNYFAPLYKTTPKETKYILFKMLFSANSNYNELKKIFANEFKELNEICILIKKRKHNNLAIVLQKLEAFTVLDFCCKQLVEAGIEVYTIHDSFIVPSNQQQQAESIINDCFLELFNEVPHFKVEAIKQPENKLQFDTKNLFSTEFIFEPVPENEYCENSFITSIENILPFGNYNLMMTA